MQNVDTMRLYRVTATTLIQAATPAFAKDQLSDHIDVDGLPHVVAIDAQEATTRPSHGENHPAVLAFHALNDAVQALRIDPAVITDLELGAASDLVEAATRHVTDLYELFQRQERTIEEQNVKIIRCDRSWAHVTEKTRSSCRA